MYLAFTWENQKFRMENQMVLPILFRKRQEIWAMIQDDAFFLLFLVCSADLDILCSGSIMSNFIILFSCTRFSPGWVCKW